MNQRGYSATIVGMTDDERQAEIDSLERKLAASQSMGAGYKDRKAAIEARLKELRDAE